MTLLVAGLALFVVLHLIPGVAPLRAGLVAGMGEKRYRGVFSALAFAGLALIVWGYSTAPFEPVYSPPGWGRDAAMWMVPAALVLFAAANMPTYIRSVVRHPMLLGLLLWALAHLAANGDLRSLVLFGGFAGFSMVAAASAVARGKRPAANRAPRLAMDVAALVSGLVVAGLFAYLHDTLFGAPAL